MGKHHWKIEKQPEWYVKAVRKTIAALPGGYAEAADWLDVTENALFNRLRADGDQIFPLGWAMVLQRAGGTHFIRGVLPETLRMLLQVTHGSAFCSQQASYVRVGVWLTVVKEIHADISRA